MPILLSYHFGGLYGVSIAAVGMLSTLGITLATDTYGPVADNAAGIAQMAGLGKKARERAEALDAVVHPLLFLHLHNIFDLQTAREKNARFKGKEKGKEKKDR